MAKENQKPAGWLHKEFGQWQLNTLLRNRLGRAALDAQLGREDTSVPLLSKETNWIIGIVGLILTGLAVLLFLSSTWQSVAISFKVAIIISFTFTCYFYSLCFKDSKTYFAWGQVLLLIATIFYGFGLWTFNHDLNLHYSAPTIFFVWAITIIPLAFFLQCQFTLALSSILFTLWTAITSMQNATPNFWYVLILGAIIFPLTYREKAWLPLVFSLIGATTWIIFSTSALFDDAVFFIPLTLLLWAIVLIGVSHIHDDKDTYPGFNRIYFGFGGIVMCAALFFLAMHAFGINMAKSWLENPGWIRKSGFLILLINILFTGISFDLFRRIIIKKSTTPILFKIELYGAGILALAVWVYTIFPEKIPEELAKSILTDHFLFYTLLFNILLYAAAFGIILIGAARKDGFVQVIAVLTIIGASAVRYFDSPWVILPRYIFLFVGGTVLLTAAYKLEKNRVQANSENNHEK